MEDMIDNSELGKATASLDRVVPKLCTTAQLGLLNNRNVVISLFYNEDPLNAALIDRVVIDVDHARSLHSALGKLLEDIEK